MSRRVYTEFERISALHRATEVGVRLAAREYDIPVDTLVDWRARDRAGVPLPKSAEAVAMGQWKCSACGAELLRPAMTALCGLCEEERKAG